MLPGYKRRIIVSTTDAEKEVVIYVQRVLRCNETGIMDDDTKSHLRGLQALFGLRTTGIIDDATAEQIDRIFPEGAL
jgi:hypothetical protein